MAQGSKSQSFLLSSGRSHLALLALLVHQGGNEPIVSLAPRGLPNPRFRRKRPGFANPWRAINYGPIYAEMY